MRKITSNVYRKLHSDDCTFIIVTTTIILTLCTVGIIILFATYFELKENERKIEEMRREIRETPIMAMPALKFEPMEIVAIEMPTAGVEKALEDPNYFHFKEKQEEVKEEEQEEENKVDEAEKELLAQLMYAEEGVFITKYYDKDPKKVERVFKLAGSVVLRRKENGYMDAKTIHDVIYSKGQYHSKTKQRIEKGQDVPDMVYDWAEDLLVDGAIGPKGLMYQAEFMQGKLYEKIWNQIFCVDAKYN